MKQQELDRAANRAALKVSRLTAELERTQEAYTKAHNEAESYRKYVQTQQNNKLIIRYGDQPDAPALNLPAMTAELLEQAFKDVEYATATGPITKTIVIDSIGSEADNA